MTVDQSWLTLKFSDRKGASVGTVTLGLRWANQPEANDEPNVNSWFIVNSSTGFDKLLMSWDGLGLFDVKSWGVMWFWDDNEIGPKYGLAPAGRHNNLILHDPPTDRYDNRHLAGRGRVYDPCNPQGKYLTVRWATFWSDPC